MQNEPLDSREPGITNDGVLVVEPLRSRPRLINPDAVVPEVKKRMFAYLKAAQLETTSFRDAHTRCLGQVPEYAQGDLAGSGFFPCPGSTCAGPGRIVVEGVGPFRQPCRPEMR
jgi:hypothetical protein